MTDERFDELMRDVARDYRVPPAPPLDAMWQQIEQAHWSAGRRRRWLPRRLAPWLAAGVGMAATLLIGIAIGRQGGAETPRLPAAAVAQMPDSPRDATPYQLATGRYLGEAVELLGALPAGGRSTRADSALVEQAYDLLSTTWILLDSPAAEDPEIRTLLLDLELVLAQVSGLSTRRTTLVEVQLINEALEERDVLPRLRTAVAELPSNIGL